jgi:outer membrane receptor protein involved in Fe transport
LLQPINITPVQPHLAESNLFILEGAGPTDPSFNEFNPLFHRNRFALQANGVVGENDTLGDEVVHSGVWGRVSYSLGQFHYETDGFRENNDQEQDLYNVFAQVSLSHKTSLQAEFRYKDIEKGDLPLRFDPTDFLPTLRQEERTDSVRLGFHHAFAPYSDLIGSFIYGEADFDTETKIDLPFPPFLVQSDLATDEDGYLAEVQHLFRFERFQVASGVGYYSADSDETVTFQPQVPPIFVNSSSTQSIRHTNLYAYSLINYPKNVTWTIGGSGDFFDSKILDRDQFNPKFGFTWNPFPDTTVRAAVLRVLRRMLISDQTIEPTQVAGFNQFFDDTRGTESWRYGIGIDQKFPKGIYGGVEYSERDLEVPIRAPGGQVRETDREEQLGRAYVNWTLHPWVALSGEYQFERFEREPDAPGAENIVELETHRFPLGISFFHPLGFNARLKATYIDQEGEFGSSIQGVEQKDDHFWTVDASIGYRLPRRWGLITLEGRNLFDEEFNFQDTDPANPRIYPERVIFGKFTLAF